MTHIDLESLLKTLAETDIEDYTWREYQHLDTDAASLKYITALQDKLKTAFEAKQRAFTQCVRSTYRRAGDQS